MKRPNPVCCIDITYIPKRHCFLYLVAVMDWATRKLRAPSLWGTGRASGRFASARSLLMRGNIAAGRQQSQVSEHPNFPGRLLDPRGRFLRL